MYFIVLFITIVGLGCLFSSDGKNYLKENDVTTDSLELVMLKNQAFCDCYYKSMKIANAHISPPDGSNYVQLSSLVEQYASDPKLNMIVDKWVEKEYLSYSKDNKLYLMRCLDFYNSSDLDAYIDSVRKEETKKLLIEFNKK